MTNNIIKALIDSGLSEKEAKIYVSLLELEIATVFEIAKYSGLNRSSTYVVLESLKKKGLAGTSPDKPITQYFASSPDILLHSAQTHAKKHEEVKNNIESIIPELKALHKDTKHRPKVKILEGKEGLIAAFEDTLKSKEKLMRVVSSPANLGHFIYDYIIEYTNNRMKIGLKMNGIHPDDKLHTELIKRYYSERKISFGSKT